MRERKHSAPTQAGTPKMARCEALISRRLSDLRGVPPRAFTLIELLVVVAIISILSAIAVPNFLEAQTRAKVSRVKNDQRTLVTALETYVIDNNKYPPRTPGSSLVSFAGTMGSVADRPKDLARLTTPISYISTVPVDIFENTLAPPFKLIEYWDNLILYDLGPGFVATTHPVTPEAEGIGGRWALVSVGPDGYMGQPTASTGWGGTNPPQPYQAAPVAGSYENEYDPTNGTVSLGNVYRFQKDISSFIIFREIH